MTARQAAGRKDRFILLSLTLLSALMLNGSVTTISRQPVVAPLPGPVSLPIDRAVLVPAEARLSDLAPAEAALYDRIFAAQQATDWALADRLIAELTDHRLIGHVQHQRLMHPTAYRASFTELQAWLSAHGDHPGADQVYRLARLRAPAANVVIDRARVAGGLSGAIEAYRGADQPLVTGHDGYASSLRAARAALYGGRDDALARAEAAIAAVPGPAPAARWIAGLAAWREGNVPVARAHFAAMLAADGLTGWARSAGAYWAGRAALAEGDRAAWRGFLAEAAEHPTTFYGVLAGHALGSTAEPSWDAPDLSWAHLDALKAYPGGARALALIDVGARAMAASELRALHPRGDRLAQEAILALADHAGLPSVSLRVATAVTDAAGRPFLGSLYPIPDLAPASGWQIDRALTFAVMRQESRFDSTARSHAGATGLMQLMPRTASFVDGERSFLGTARFELMDPELNLDLGQRYLAHLLSTDLVGGDLIKLTVAYNAGYGTLRRWLDSVAHDDDPLLFLETIPVAETRAFAERVLTNYWLYRARLGQQRPSLSALVNGDWPPYVAQDDSHLMVADAY